MVGCEGLTGVMLVVGVGCVKVDVMHKILFIHKLFSTVSKVRVIMQKSKIKN